MPDLNLEPFLAFMLPDELTPGIFEEAVPGRLPVLGGWGKAAILIVLRRDLSGLLGGRPLDDADRGALTLIVELDNGDLLRVGRGLEEARSFDGD